MQPLRRDPAPSRWAWRIERWMLTPGVRLGLRVGVPFVLTLSIGSWYLGQPHVQAKIADSVSEIRASIEERPEFMVNLMAIDGVGAELAETIRAEIPLDFPVSSFDLDLEEMRRTFNAMDPVQSATVRIRSGGILQVDVTPRVPAAIWRTDGGLHLLDATGHPVRPIALRSDAPALPLLVGEGAELHVEEALRVLRAASSLKPRLRGLQRVGERRWDLVLDRGQRILLPGDHPVRALERMLVLDATGDLLARDVSHIDLRLNKRPTIRKHARPVEERASADALPQISE